MIPTLTRRVGTIILLSLVSIPLHELGHYTVYRFANIPVHITFQSVHPIAPIRGPIAVLGLAAGLFAHSGLSLSPSCPASSEFFLGYSSLHQRDTPTISMHHGLAARLSRIDAVF